jgi:hypothetical protein
MVRQCGEKAGKGKGHHGKGEKKMTTKIPRANLAFIPRNVLLRRQRAAFVDVNGIYDTLCPKCNCLDTNINTQYYRMGCSGCGFTVSISRVSVKHDILLVDIKFALIDAWNRHRRPRRLRVKHEDND